ncbi:MAG: alpha/beta hydrolase, partial [Burkholderiaceae bacterium]|nr:alpha/beta hydrolase [Burkholderiaceae bacterium]
MAEALHAAILRSTLPFAATPGGQTRGITGLSYCAVRQLTRRIGSALDVGFARLARAPGEAGTSTVARSAALAVLNGVLGDHLAATRNPLAIRMSLRHDGRSLRLERTALAMQYPHAQAHLVVLAHGLCMNDLQWARKGHDHGAALARDLACTPLYLHY